MSLGHGQLAPRAHLLSMPGEIRDMIYEHYIRIDAEDGYILHFETGKLRTATKKPIDLNLMYTCRQVADEMQGLALKIQPITFKTLYSRDLSFRAARFRRALIGQGHGALDNGLGFILKCLLRKDLIDPSMRKKINDHFGHDMMGCFERVYQWRRFRRHGPNFKDKAACAYRVKREALELAITDPKIYNYITKEYHPDAKVLRLPPGSDPDWETVFEKDQDYPIDAILALERGIDRWWIPTHEELDALARENRYYRHSDSGFEIHPQYPGELAQSGEFYEEARRSKGLLIRRFSAAAAAVHFLKSIPPATRSQIRTVLVHEDFGSIGGPTDILGLVPFCAENPHLRIQQRVDICGALLRWTRNISEFTNFHPDTDFYPDHKRYRSWQTRLEFQDDFPRVLSEQLALFKDNMVPEAITTIFVAETEPRWTRALVQRSLAEVTALITSSDPTKTDGSDYMRFSTQWICDNWVEAVQAMVRNERPGQVRIDLKLDSRLESVWSSAEMAAQMAMINKTVAEFNLDRGSPYISLLDEWWKQCDVKVGVPKLKKSINKALYLDSSRLGPWDEHPPTTLDGIVRHHRAPPPDYIAP
ncbi:hypothetical protein QBC39DRAFT_355838 [Podospora conica]|nr:hypothetical protein QBC39DRAFT_355838 [Schizothecium conicum]